LALRAIDHDIKLKIYGSDINPDAIELAKENACLAGVDDCIEFFVSDFRNVNIKEDYGVIICNPPYGERIGEQQEVETINKDMGKTFSKYDTWSKYIITRLKTLNVFTVKKPIKSANFTMET